MKYTAIALMALALAGCNSHEAQEDLTTAVACGTTCALMAETMTFIPDPDYGDGDSNDAKRRWLRVCAVNCAVEAMAEE